jgi:L-ascorbate metabolism protein UlaG (beta-lactamase superfamily)
MPWSSATTITTTATWQRSAPTLLPVNGLRIRPQFNKQVVMNAEQAAELTAALGPRVTVPHHYAFTSGRLGDKLITKGDRDPGRFVSAASQDDGSMLDPGRR